MTEKTTEKEVESNSAKSKNKKDNVMRQIKIEKITLNIGSGKEQKELQKGMKLLKMITGVSPVKTYAKKRIPTWGLRPGLPIGCKITLRKEQAVAVLKRLLESKSFFIPEKQFDNSGSVSFGIPEYIDIPETKYDPDIGIIGLEVCVTLERPGFRVKKRSNKRTKIKKQSITKSDAIGFMEKKFNIKTREDEE